MSKNEKIKKRRRPYIDWPTFSAQLVLLGFPRPVFTHHGDTEVLIPVTSDKVPWDHKPEIRKLFRAHKLAITRTYKGWIWGKNGVRYDLYRISKWRFKHKPVQNITNTWMGWEAFHQYNERPDEKLLS